MGEVIPLLVGERRPWLVCCNLRAERIAPESPLCSPHAQRIVSHLLRLLQKARSFDWRVVHVVGRMNQKSDGFSGPIDGLAPWKTEAVFEPAGLSAFSSTEFEDAACKARASALYVAGYGLGDIVFATIAAGLDLSLNMVLVEDAVAASPLEASVQGDADSVLKAVIRTMAPSVSVESLARQPIACDRRTWGEA